MNPPSRLPGSEQRAPATYAAGRGDGRNPPTGDYGAEQRGEGLMTLHEAIKAPPPGRAPKDAEEALIRDIKEDMEGVTGSSLTPSARMRMTEMIQGRGRHELCPRDL